MVKRYHGSFPSFSYGFDSRYPLHALVLETGKLCRFAQVCCAHCHVHGRRAALRMASTWAKSIDMKPNAPSTPSFWAIATTRSVVLRATRIALIVGIVIALINYGDRMVMATMDATSWLKCMMTFLVPYCVSTYSAVQAVRDRAREQGG